MKVILHIGCCSLAETIELAEHAKNLPNILAIAIIAPYYVPLQCGEQMVTYIKVGFSNIFNTIFVIEKKL